MGSDPDTARFEAAVHGRASQWHNFDSLVDAVVWISERVDAAPADQHVIGTVRDSAGRMVAACDNQGRTWTEVDGVPGQIAEWKERV